MKISAIAIDSDFDARDIANALHSAPLVEQYSFLNSYFEFLGIHNDPADLRAIGSNLNPSARAVMKELLDYGVRHSQGIPQPESSQNSGR